MNEEKNQSTDRRNLLKYAGFGILGGWVGKILSARNSYAGAPRLAHAMWIHGHSMQIEYPSNIASTWRAGFYIRVEGKRNTTNWFHFAIPTPVIVNDKRLRADSVMLFFRTMSSNAIINEVHVFDGDTVISPHKNLNLTGNIGPKRFMIKNRPAVKWGIGISIGVSFGNSSGSRRMEFISAGCDFAS